MSLLLCHISNVISYLWLLALLEESFLWCLLFWLLSSKVLWVWDFLDLGLVDTGQIDLGGCGDNVTSVNSADGDTVDLEWAGHEENTLVKSLQEDDTLATETTSEEDQDFSGFERWSNFGWSDGFADLEFSLLVMWFWKPQDECPGMQDAGVI